MGSIKSIKRSKCGGGPPGKIKASLDEKLKNVEWGKYKLENLFDVRTSKSIDEGKLVLLPYKQNDLIEFVGRTKVNNGVKGYVQEFDLLPNEAEVISVSQIGTITAQMRPSKWYASQNMFVLEPKEKSIISFFTVSAINRALSCFSDGYSYYPTLTSLKELVIELPIKNGKIDFDFMESFIAELEAERIAELKAYLSVSRLDNYELSDAEMSALTGFEALEWKDFKLTEILTPKNTRSILSSSIIENSGTTPYLCASAENNSVSSYIDYEKNMLDEGNCIFIGGKTFVISYQEEDFYSNDSHNLALYLINKKYREKLPQLYLATCIYKSLKHKYSWGDSISKQKIQSDFVTLPAKNNQPNFEIMETFISAVEKLVIKDVVMYADRKTKATNDVINK